MVIMKLYYSKGACSLVPRIIINELKIPCEFESVDLTTKITQSQKNFYEINPKGYVPTIVTDDNKVLTENTVILQYLADHYGAAFMLPATKDFERYRILEWLNFISTELHKNFAVLFNPKFPQTIKNEIQMPLLQQKFEIVENQLAKNEFLTGDHFSLPDAYLFVVLRWAVFFKLDLKSLPNLIHFFNTMLARPSVKKSLSEEELPNREIA